MNCFGVVDGLNVIREGLAIIASELVVIIVIMLSRKK